MNAIKTEYGTVYLDDPDDLNDLDGSQIDGEFTRTVGEDKWLDTSKYKTSWVKVTVIALSFFIAGLFIGFVLMHDQSFRLTGFITIIIIACVLRYARRELIRYESAYIEMVHEARQDELKLLAEQKKADARKVKILNAAKKVQAEVNKESKVQAGQYKFTSEDFDNDAQGMLLRPVKIARKHKARVTGQGLVETFLKGIK